MEKLSANINKIEDLLKEGITTNFFGLKAYTILENTLNEIKKLNNEDVFGTKYTIVEDKTFEEILKLTFENKEDDIIFNEENEAYYPEREQSEKKEVFYILKILYTNRIVFLKKTSWY
ncbi:hypothetical protein GTH52_15250 (plasmid) [Clostridium tyrobutyricum]|jgi:hypothetical protein|uniref:Uncharacterized protein n=1 Tax=Clostridium tyrobutyricum DIVETGP TaxID=1408889 RepID=W6N400_CLOTY|nr:hypothetical protein [Clostridium tyrobutyricum]AND86346.1 hypothetical protein CTK_P00480 [Clostridium tyrobutyricum]ANP70973.1 hypothetical protein BA182_14865 [Clostridium tyrobutyricum]MBV4432477.1 hypothetical protein [Clostridium tyrobutyricum]MBV4435670.1 hypothetical protein [Clostridium tyrobutyricum]QNB68237.1 hypothetical protein GTH52_15250 [Clostridium tyrobutyricum]